MDTRLRGYERSGLVMSTRRKIAYVLIGIVGVIAAAITYVAYEIDRPHREVANDPFMRSISKQTNKWDTRVSLLPEHCLLAQNFLMWRRCYYHQNLHKLTVSTCGGKVLNKNLTTLHTQA